MRKIFVSIILFGCLFLLIAPLVSADFFAHCYWIPQGKRVPISWAPVPDAASYEPNTIYYELQVRRMENGKTVYQTRTTGTQFAITWKTPGHYVIYVRWQKGTTFGEWKNSLDENSSLVLVGEVLTPRAWVIIVPTSY